jgi:hypothetical protein
MVVARPTVLLGMDMAEGHAPPNRRRPIRPSPSREVGMHLRDHQKCPATREELLASCNNLVDFSDGEKRWFADHLPDWTYKSAATVLKALRK